MHSIGTSYKRLRKLIKKIEVNVLAISKPFMKEEALPCFATVLDFTYWCTNEAMNSKIWVIWKEQDIFDAFITIEQTISSWSYIMGRKTLLTFVHAKCSYHEPQRLWSNLENLLGSTVPWIAMGDFNYIQEEEEFTASQPIS